MLAPRPPPAKVLVAQLVCGGRILAPATASAPAGSRMERVSSKTSLIAAQMASLSTTIISSTYCWHRRKVSAPTSLTAAPSAEDADLLERDALARGERLRHRVGVHRLDADDLRLRAQALDVGRHAGDQPAAADGSRTPRGSASGARRISRPTVPWPAITSGSSKGWTKVSFSLFSRLERVRVGVGIGFACRARPRRRAP